MDNSRRNLAVKNALREATSGLDPRSLVETMLPLLHMSAQIYPTDDAQIGYLLEHYDAESGSFDWDRFDPDVYDSLEEGASPPRPDWEQDADRWKR